METSVFFGLFFGLIGIFTALSVVVNGYDYNKVIGDIEHNHISLLIMATMQLLLGLLVLILHPIYEFSWEIVITLTGWMLLLKSASLFLLPANVLSLASWMVNKAKMHNIALISFIYGVFLLLGASHIL